MKADDIAAAQYETIAAALHPGANYVVRLKKRMEKLGFPRHDPLYALVATAQLAMQNLCVEVHYRSCKGGVCRPEKGQAVIPWEEIDARRARGENVASSTEE